MDVHRESVTACARLVDNGEVFEELERFSTTAVGWLLWVAGCWIGG